MTCAPLPAHANPRLPSQVVFRNRARVPTSIHAHGVRYSKANEGTLYEDGSDPATDKADDVVAPGQTYTYTWHVRVCACVCVWGGGMKSGGDWG